MDSLESNLRRWTSEGKLIRVRRGWFMFPDEADRADIRMAAAGKIYAPSYISLEYALAWYELIPEAVLTVTSVSTLKTQDFDTPLGMMSYRHVKPSLFFGYAPLSALGSIPCMMASREKALLDLLYFHPEYKRAEDMEALRLDEMAMREEVDSGKLRSLLERTHNKALQQRAELLIRV